MLIDSHSFTCDVGFDLHMASLDTFLAGHIKNVQSIRHGLAAALSTRETTPPPLSLGDVNVQLDTIVNQFGIVVITVSRQSRWILLSTNY